MSEQLGSASLELQADLVPFDDDLDKAEKRAAAFVAATQAILDKLHLNLRDDGSLGSTLSKLSAGAATMATEWAAASDAVRASLGKVDSAIAHTAAATVAASEVERAAIDSVTAAYLEQAAAARAAADAGLGRVAGADLLGLLGGRGGGGRHGAGLSAAEAAAAATAFEGVRGKGHVGSRTNPLVVVLAAGSREPLGSYAAAVGEQAASGGGITPGVVPSGSGGSGAVGAATGGSRGSSAVAAGTSRTDQRDQAVREAALAAAMSKLDQAITGSQQRPGGVSTVVLPGARRQQGNTNVILPAGVESKGQGSGKAIPVIVKENDPRAASAAGDAVAGALAAEAAKSRMPGQFAPTAAADIAALEALGMTAARSPSGATRIYGVGGVPGTGNYGASPFAAAAGGGAAGSGGGGGSPPWLSALLFGHAGGGGGGGRRLPGYAGAALGGALGIGAGFGSLGSFAGFGAEHIVLTAGGIAGSGVAALGGGALLGAGALGKIGVGGGSDLAVMKSTITDTAQLYKGYEAVTKAVRTYGKGSEQAKEASKELNTIFLELGNTAGVKAEAGVAKATVALNAYWDQATSGARVQGSKILMQFVELGHAYVKPVAKAAEENLPLISKGLKPLFEWLKGPEGMGIFLQLENEFRNEIPTAMKALDQGFEFFAKTVAYTAPLTGAFIKKLDDFFTKWNQPGQFSVWEGEMNKLIDDFHVWGAFIKELGGALVDLFDKDAHTGEGIIETLTAMLHKVREYEKSTAGGEAIHNIFTVHKAEAIALLEAIAPLISAFTHIYTTVSPPLVEAVTNIAEAFTKVLIAIEKTGALGTWVIGLTLIAAKLKVLVPLLKAAGVETGVLTAEEDKNAVAGGLDAAAQGGLAGTTGLVGGSAYQRAMAAQEGSDALAAGGLTAEAGAGGLLTKSTLLKGGIYGVGGLVAGSLVASATGAKGTLASALGDAGAGAGVGFALGGPLGAVLGAGIGASAPYVVKAITGLFSVGTEHAVTQASREAKRYLEGGRGLLGPAESQHYAAPLSKALANPAIVTAREAARYQHVTGASTAEIAKLQAEAAPAYAKAGEVAGKAFIEGEQHVQTPTRLSVITEIVKRLEELPAQARGGAAKVMLAYAAQLEASGALPKNAVAGFVAYIKHKFSEVAPYIASQGSTSTAAIAKAFELQGVKAKLGVSLSGIERRWGVSFENTQKGQLEAIHFLQETFRNNTGATAEAAREWLSGIVPVAEHEWKLAAEVTAEGIARINKELTSEIKQLGGSEIQAGFGGKTKPGAPVEGKGINLRSEPTPFGKAQGGLLQIGRPGDAGHDTVGLNVGGLPIAVGPGEQVAVFNRHQQPIVNDALAAAGYGGLPGLFGAVTTPNYMASGGLIPDVVQAGLADVRKDARTKVAHMSSIAGAHGAVGASGGRSAGTAQMRAWAKAGLEAAGVPATQGNIETIVGRMMQESSGNPDAINLTDSNAAAGHPSQGLMQTIPETFATYHVPGTSSNILNPVANVAAAVRYMLAVYGHLVGAGPGGYALGGLLSFAGGGIVPPGVKAKFPQRSTAGKIPKGFGAHTFGKIPPVKTSWSGQGAWAALNAMMGATGPLAQATEQYGLEETADELALSLAPHGGAFVITPDALERAAGITSPFLEQGNVNLRSGQLSSLNVTEHGVLNDLTEAWNWSQQVLAAASAGISERNAAIAELKARIEANLKAIKKCRETIVRQEKELAKIPTGKKATPADRAHTAKLKQELADEHGQLRSLELENQRLGGSASSVGTGGNIGAITNEITNLSTAKASTEGWVQEIGGTTGKGGKRQESENTIAKLAQQMVELGQTPERLKEALLESGSGPESALELSERNLAQTEEKLKISKQETRISNQALSVFGGSGDIGTGGKNAFAAAAAHGGLFVPMSYAGSFGGGGTVGGGPPGAAMLATVHVGETISTPEQQGGSHFHQHNHIETLTPADPAMLLAIGKAATRGQRLQGARLAKRLVPGV